MLDEQLALLPQLEQALIALQAALDPAQAAFERAGMSAAGFNAEAAAAVDTLAALERAGFDTSEAQAGRAAAPDDGGLTTTEVGGGFASARVRSAPSVSAFALPADPIDPALVQHFADFGGQGSLAAQEWEILRGEVDRTAEAGREAGRLVSGALRSMVFDGPRARASAARRVGSGCGGARPWAGAHALLIAA